MSRLLFAAARGARIQALCGNWRNAGWVTIGYHFEDSNTDNLRIHPDDEHLQYGPVSTALRKRSETGFVTGAHVPYIVGGFVFSDDEWEVFLDADAYLQRSLFLLILAEALADEGL